jgi:SNF2 family DNA or RNA helicase
MFVHKEKRALIFKLREPSKITTVIPTAKLIKHNGDTLVAVPHRPDEVRVLRTLGFNAPDPMRLYYNWPGRYKPMKEQIETASFATMNDRCFVLNSMGTGKTITVLWTYDYLRSIKLVKRMLVICPMSVMERTWADHIFQSFPHLDVKVLYGTADRRRKLLANKADVYIVNVDGLNIIRNDLATRPDIDLIVADESALYRNGSTQRW